MSIKAGIGISNKPDPVIAAKDAARQALDDIKKPDLLIAFSSVNYLQQHVVNGLRETVKDIPIVGCSDAGEITPYGLTSGSVAVMALASDTIKFSAAAGSRILDSSRKAGELLSENILKESGGSVSALIMLSDIISGNGSEIVRGVENVLGGDILVAGAAAGDDFLFKETYIYFNGRAVPSSLVGIGLSGKYSIGVGVRHGWIPIGLPVTVTRSHGALVEELDNKPAVAFYEDNFGMKAGEMIQGAFAQLAITYPLGMKIPDSDELLIRYPIDIHSDGSIRFTSGIPAGSQVRLMLGSREEAIKAVEYAAASAVKQLAGAPVKLALIFSSIARRKLLAQKAGQELKEIQDLIGRNVPLLGFHSYGEFAPIAGRTNSRKTYFHNEAIAVILIGD